MISPAPSPRFLSWLFFRDAQRIAVLLLLSSSAALSGCGGGGGGYSNSNSGGSSTASATSTVTGTASLGAAIAGGVVTLKDANGMTATGTTAGDGTLTLNTAGMSPPFLVKVVTATPSGAFPAGTTLYSVSADSNLTTNINVHVLSDLIVRSYYSANGVDVDTAFANPTGSGNAAPTPLAVQTIAAAVIQVVQLWLSSASLTVTSVTPATGGSINLIASTFTANNTGLDSVLHLITGETVNSVTGVVTGLTVASGTVSETATPSYSGSAVTVATTTTNSSSGAKSSESIGAVALNGTLQTDYNAILAQLVALQTTVTNNSTSLTSSQLLPYYASDYINGGNTASADAATLAAQVSPGTITGMRISTINSINTTTNIADVVASFTSSHEGSKAQEFYFKEENGSWLIYGDQRVAQLNLQIGPWTSQGSGTIPDATYIITDAQALHGVITSGTISGGGNIWPNCTTDSSCNSGSSVSTTMLQDYALIVNNGQSYDRFQLLSNPLANNALPAAGSPFIFNLITTTYGTRASTVPLNSSTTEQITFSGLPGTGGGPLSSILGQTVTYHWSLPTTFPVAQITLHADYLNGPGGNQSTINCSVSASGLTAASTSGSISIPSSMSTCGSSGSIVQVNVYLGVTGVNGEFTTATLSYPY
jgi:hypothetical protein